MTNFEKNKDTIINILLTTGETFAVKNRRDKIGSCSDIKCDRCLFYNDEEFKCDLDGKKEWLNAEYIEPKKIDLPKDIERGTIVEVSHDGISWLLRRFYSYSSDGVRVMKDGALYLNSYDVNEYSYARIPEVIEKERENVLKAVIDCGWNCEIHSDKALYEMVDKQLKGGE